MRLKQYINSRYRLRFLFLPEGATEKDAVGDVFAYLRGVYRKLVYFPDDIPPYMLFTKWVANSSEQTTYGDVMDDVWSRLRDPEADDGIPLAVESHLARLVECVKDTIRFERIIQRKISSWGPEPLRIWGGFGMGKTIEESPVLQKVMKSVKLDIGSLTGLESEAV